MEIETVRCQCGKIVFQRDADSIVIKCRHCKRYLVIKTRGVVSMEYHDLSPGEEVHPPAQHAGGPLSGRPKLGIRA